MSQGNYYSADIPVTDLDDEDDFIVTTGQNGSTTHNEGVFNEDFETLNSKNKSKLKKAVSKIKDAVSIKSQQHQHYRHIQNSFTPSENIELQSYPASFSSDDASSTNHKFLNEPNSPASLLKTITFIVGTLAFIGVLVVSSVAISNYKQGQMISSVTNVKKPTLNNGTHLFYPTTIMISLDGFHPHYISSELTPFMHNLYINSYGPPFMIPSFPSSTFPNHWSLVTGLYPAFHGIVGNTFFSPMTNKQFVNVKADLSLDTNWWGGEPIWQTAYSHGVASAVHMWPGSEVNLTIGNPLEVDKFKGSELLSAKVDRILEWLDRDISTRPELMLGYVPTIDSLGHRHGIAGKELKDGLKYVDNFIESLIVEIKERNLTDIVNFVIVSDHGMSPTSNKRLIYLDDIVDLKKIQHTDGWPLFGLRPFKQFSVEEVFQSMNETYHKLDNPHFKIYLKTDMPEEWHFGNSGSKFDERIAPIWIVPDVGYAITTKKDMEKSGGNYKLKGIHGYNNTEVLMRALFIGTGPYFSNALGGEKFRKIKPFQNTEVYNLVCDTLNLRPAKNNGTGTSIIFNKKNILESNWTDPLSYPNVPFDSEVIRENATYDVLFRNESGVQRPVEVPLNPTESLLSSEEATGAPVTSESVPGATFKLDLSSIEATWTAIAAASTSVAAKSATLTTGPESGKSANIATSGGAESTHTRGIIADFIEDTIEKIEDEVEEIYNEVGGAIDALRHKGQNDHDKEN